LITKYMLTC